MAENIRNHVPPLRCEYCIDGHEGRYCGITLPAKTSDGRCYSKATKNAGAFQEKGLEINPF